MKSIIAILFSILSVFSLKEMSPKPKLCINCKFFTNSDGVDNIYGKCSSFPLLGNRVTFLVSGIEKKDYFYCSTARENGNMCGKEGKMYKKRIVNETNNYNISNNISS